MAIQNIIVDIHGINSIYFEEQQIIPNHIKYIFIAFDNKKEKARE